MQRLAHGLYEGALERAWCHQELVPLQAVRSRGAALVRHRCQPRHYEMALLQMEGQLPEGVARPAGIVQQ